MKKEETEIMETPDLYYAAFLQVKGCELEKTEKQRNKTIFFFSVPLSVDYKKAYFNQHDDKHGSVSACKFANAIKNLKTLCYVRKEEY